MTKPFNNLAGMQCPKCGHNAGFKIEATCLATVFDDGVDDSVEYDWSEHSGCRCNSCKHHGVVGDFQGSDVAASFCQEKLLGETTHPRIGAIYALMRQASLHYPDVTGLCVGALDMEFMEGESVYQPLPPVDATLVAEVMGDPTLRGKTFHFMPKGGLPSESMVVLSTGHLPQSEINAAVHQLEKGGNWAIGANRDTGFLMYTAIEDCPLSALRKVLALMRNAGYIWVLFDGDGELVDGLPDYL